MDCSSERGLLTERGVNDYTETPRQCEQEEFEVSSSSLSTTEESDSMDCSSERRLLTERGVNDYAETPRQCEQEEIVTNLGERRQSLEKMDILFKLFILYCIYF